LPGAHAPGYSLPPPLGSSAAALSGHLDRYGDEERRIIDVRHRDRLCSLRAEYECPEGPVCGREGFVIRQRGVGVRAAEMDRVTEARDVSVCVHGFGV